MKRTIVGLVFALTAATMASGEENKPLLFQKPAVSRTHVAVGFAGELWLVEREGGEAKRLSNGVGLETDPTHSADGTHIALTGEYEGNLDVYVVSAAVGAPH